MKNKGTRFSSQDALQLEISGNYKDLIIVTEVQIISPIWLKCDISLMLAMVRNPRDPVMAPLFDLEEVLGKSF